MSPVLGNLIVIIILAVLVFFAARSIWRSHKSGGCAGCSGCGGGSCAGCSGCGSFAPDHRSVPDNKTSVNGGCQYCKGVDN